MSKYIILGEVIRFITHQPRVVHTLLELGAVEVARDLLDSQLMIPQISKKGGQILNYLGKRTSNVIWQLELPTDLLDQAKQALLEAGYKLDEWHA